MNSTNQFIIVMLTRGVQNKYLKMSKFARDFFEKFGAIFSLAYCNYFV